jgi:hypothetical protein
MAKDPDNRLYWRANPKRLDAEQLRDSILLVSGNLETSFGGPSEALTPAFKRRTVYGKVSRYKLDEYLQLFDFPNPSISAEKRFTTTVPLQRLFLMNSDFMQIQAEELAKRVAAEADNRSRIRKLYQIAFGREPLEKEVALGIEYLKTEPLLEYEEGKKRKPEETKPRRGRPDVVSKAEPGAEPPAEAGGGQLAAKDTMPIPDMPAAETAADMPPMEGAAAAPPMGMGMMGGMGMMMPGGRRGGPGAGPAEVKYDPTAWGRYAKVLLSSSEFLYIN